MIPNCPVHGTPMRPGNRGGYFCPQKVGAGPKDYCAQRVAAPPAPTPHVNSNPSPQPQSARDGKYHLAAAALTAASWIHGQVLPDFHPQVMETARFMYREMKALVES